MKQKIYREIWFLAIWNNKIYGESVHNQKANLVEAEEDQTNLLKIYYNLIINLDQKTKKVRIKKEILMKANTHLWKSRIANCSQKWNIFNKSNTRKRIKHTKS